MFPFSYLFGMSLVQLLKANLRGGYGNFECENMVLELRRKNVSRCKIYRFSDL